MTDTDLNDRFQTLLQRAETFIAESEDRLELSTDYPTVAFVNGQRDMLDRIKAWWKNAE